MFLHIGNRAFNVKLIEQIEFKGKEIVIFFVGNDIPLTITKPEEVERFKLFWEKRAEVWFSAGWNYGEEE